MTGRPRKSTVDPQYALEVAAGRLAEDYAREFDTETVERILHSSYDQLTAQAAIARSLPLLAERFASQRLSALSRVENKVGEGWPVVLFLCVDNAGRSQMAMSFFRFLTGVRAMAWSGGSEPGREVDPAAVEVMREVGLDIATEFPKPWTDEVARSADVVVSMGCGDAFPTFPGKRHEEWTLDDPDGQDLAAVRSIRDEVEGRVRGLLAELEITPCECPGATQRPALLPPRACPTCGTCACIES